MAPRYPLTIKWSKDMDDFCERHRIFLAHPFRTRGIYGLADSIRINHPVLVESYGTVVKHHFFSIGAFSFATDYLPHNTQIGRYTSIAPRVGVMLAQHPTDRFTTSPITYLHRWPEFAMQEFGADWQLDPFEEWPPAALIGNDVWIGQDVLIKGGVKIGDGACIAARAVITKDVEPYSIVGGVPARLIRYRFSEIQRERLLGLKWWQYRFTDLPRIRSSDIDGFASALEDKIAAGLQPWHPGIVDLGAALSEIVNKQAQ